MLTIDLDLARRFILGKQGLWPGRRWRGIQGTAQAMRAMEYLQLDPLQIIARSHDIALHSRVLDYTPGLWEEVTYEQRHFFDWGGWLATRPMEELPHWRVIMHRERDGGPDCDPRVRKNGREHAEPSPKCARSCASASFFQQPRLRMADRTRNAKLSRPQGQRAGPVPSLAHRRSDDPPSGELRACVCPYRSGRAGAI